MLVKLESLKHEASIAARLAVQQKLPLELPSVRIASEIDRQTDECFETEFTARTNPGASRNAKLRFAHIAWCR